MDPNTTANTTTVANNDQTTVQNPITTNATQLNDVIIGGAF